MITEWWSVSCITNQNGSSEDTMADTINTGHQVRVRVRVVDLWHWVKIVDQEPIGCEWSGWRACSLLLVFWVTAHSLSDWVPPHSRLGMVWTYSCVSWQFFQLCLLLPFFLWIKASSPSGYSLYIFKDNLFSVSLIGKQVSFICAYLWC